MASGGLRKIVQHLMHDDGIGDAVAERQSVDVAVAHLGVGKRRAVLSLLLA